MRENEVAQHATYIYPSILLTSLTNGTPPIATLPYVSVWECDKAFSYVFQLLWAIISVSITIQLVRNFGLMAAYNKTSRTSRSSISGLVCFVSILFLSPLLFFDS